MMQSFIGLAGLIFEINGKNWQFITFLQSKPNIDAVMLRIYAPCTQDIFAITQNAARYMNLRLGAYGLSL